MKIMLANHKKMSVEKCTNECFSFLKQYLDKNTFQYEYCLKHLNQNNIFTLKKKINTPFDGKPITEQEVLKCRVKLFLKIVAF